MTNAYRAVQWNAHKKTYDRYLWFGIVVYLAAFIGITVWAHPEPNNLAPEPILLMRATGTCAFLMLHVILLIGPLARMSDRFVPLLYNRRHFGVSMFLVALLHGFIALNFYNGFGNVNAIVGLFTGNLRYDSLAQFPFETLGFAALGILFVMAATSHDFWLKNLGASVWKALHMSVYVAYGLLVMHVTLGVLQSETSSIYVGLVGLGLFLVAGTHLAAGKGEWRRDRDGDREAAGDWVRVAKVSEIPMDRAAIVCSSSGERIAVFRAEQGLSAISNVCAHQGGPLGEGQIVNGCLTCPWHGYQYWVDRGQSPPPFTEKVPTYRLELRGDEVFVHPEPLAPGTPVPPTPIP
jgi:sulfoxide reductase heme-binding subunit YedZ